MTWNPDSVNTFILMSGTLGEGRGDSSSFPLSAKSGFGTSGPRAGGGELLLYTELRKGDNVLC